jgi:hypothetical protein
MQAVPISLPDKIIIIELKLLLGWNTRFLENWDIKIIFDSLIKKIINSIFYLIVIYGMFINISNMAIFLFH